VPLVVPEVNAHALRSIPKGIVANPNCTTMPPCRCSSRCIKRRDSHDDGVDLPSGERVRTRGVDELAAQLESLYESDVRVLTFDGGALVIEEGVKFPAVSRTT